MRADQSGVVIWRSRAAGLAPACRAVGAPGLGGGIADPLGAWISLDDPEAPHLARVRHPGAGA